MTRTRWLVVLIALLVLALGTGAVTAYKAQSPAKGPTVASLMGTAFTYQGVLTDGGLPANGGYDLRFRVFDALTAGAQVGNTVLVENKTVTNGLFTVLLDFGPGVFTGDARWLQIEVRPGADVDPAPYTLLSPRQELTPTPYALYAANAWALLGNAGTTPGTNFLGTTDNQALELKVNGLRALRVEPNPTTPNLIGGHSINSVVNGVFGAVIAGGGYFFDIINQYPNRVTDNWGTIGGGYDNQAGDNAGTTADKAYASVGGGVTNTASGPWSTVGGGSTNTASGDYATVGGGFPNNAVGHYSTVGGGGTNNAVGNYSTVAGGYFNQAPGGVASVGGGYFSAAIGNYSTVGGGLSNTASGGWATVPGGNQNIASGDYSFAAGRNAQAVHQGAFVWADSPPSYFLSSSANQFNVRAGGGTRIFSDSAATVGVNLAPGGNSWSALSDSAFKQNFTSVDGREVLEKLAAVRIGEWNLTSQDSSIQHIGPTAQDFYAAFGVGEDNRHITQTDADGVALAAIQGLYQMVQEKDARIAALEQGTGAASSSQGFSWTSQGITWGLMAGILLVGLYLALRLRRGAIPSP